MTADDLPDLPLDAPLAGLPGPHRRPEPVAPAPRWVGPLYIALAVLLVPWTVYLSLVLPERTTSGHWDVAWVGFDVMEFIALAATAWFALRRSTWVEVAATASAVLLCADAWFDVTTATGKGDMAQAIAQAVVVELPLAGLSLWIARHAETVNETATRWLLARTGRQAEWLRRIGADGPDEDPGAS